MNDHCVTEVERPECLAHVLSHQLFVVLFHRAHDDLRLILDGAGLKVRREVSVLDAITFLWIVFERHRYSGERGELECLLLKVDALSKD